MAERGIYLCVVRQDSALPVVVHNSIQRNDEAGQQAAMDQAWTLFQNTKGRIPFAVAEIHLSPVTQPLDRAREALSVPPVTEAIYAMPPDSDGHDHRPIQHRDGKPPWCRVCGLTAQFTAPQSRFQKDSEKA